ncbi:MAG: lipid-A-disaccharide synthase [Planctomycetota bacterium]
MPSDTSKPGLLFTAFEPSGDDHASSVIAELRRRYPDLPMYAWGGPKMKAAGAEVVERTGDDAVMGLPGLAKIREHGRINKRIDAWLAERGKDIALHIPVDSPAANFPICAIAKRRGLKVVHLVAPQIWAWGGWRIRKLRRLTDKVLCLLPFEETWFRERGVDAQFIGHPLFDETPSEETLAAASADLPDRDAEHRLAIMPGSRPGEIAKNFPLLLAAFRDVLKRFPGAAGMVAATTPQVEERLKAIASEHGGWPDRLHVVNGRTDSVVHWCTIALVVSGTVTLQITRQRRPMVIFYKSSPLMYTLFARWLLSTEFFTLPNLVAGREIVPELVPHFDGHEPIAAEAIKLLDNPALVKLQKDHLDGVAGQFAGRCAAESAADAIASVAGLPRREPTGSPVTAS